MELHAHLSDRQECLGREQQHEQPHLERQVTREKSEPHRHRDQSHGDRGQQLHREARQEREPQHLHGLAAVLVGRDLDAIGRAAITSEQSQRRQSLHRVGEAGGQALERLPLARLHRARRHPDQDQEDGDQRQGDHRGETARPVLPPHHRDQHRRRDHGQHQLRDVPGEVGVERLEPVTCGDRELGLIPLCQPPRAQLPDRRDERRTQLHPGLRGGACACRVGRGDQQSA